jgi:hypothetical protein
VYPRTSTAVRTFRRAVSGDAVAAVEDARDGGHADAGVAGDVGESAAHGSTIAMTVTLRLDLQLDFACPQRKKGNDGPPSLV